LFVCLYDTLGDQSHHQHKTEADVSHSISVPNSYLNLHNKKIKLPSYKPLRIPHWLDSRLKDGGKVVSLTPRPPFTPHGHFVLYLVLISVTRNKQQGLLRPELLAECKKLIYLIGSRSCDFPACSTITQPTALPRAGFETR
jgi:hypothetical protein